MSLELGALASSYGDFSTSGVVSFVTGVAVFILANALAYLLSKAFNIKYGRLLGGIITVVFGLILVLSTSSTSRFRGVFTLGIGEILVGGLDAIQVAGNISQPLFTPSVGCSGQ